MKTDRLTLLISPAEKAELTAKAASMGMTISEMMRRAAQGFDPARDAQLEEVGALTAELDAALTRVRGKFDAAYAEADSTRAHIARREEDMQAALAALEADRSIDWTGIQWLFGLGKTVTPASEQARFSALVDRIITARPPRGARGSLLPPVKIEEDLPSRAHGGALP